MHTFHTHVVHCCFATMNYAGQIVPALKKTRVGKKATPLKAGCDLNGEPLPVEDDSGFQ